MSGDIHDRTKEMVRDHLAEVFADPASVTRISAVFDAAHAGLRSLGDLEAMRPESRLEILGGVALLIASLAVATAGTTAALARPHGDGLSRQEVAACACGIVTAVALTAGHLVTEMDMPEAKADAVKH